MVDVVIPVFNASDHILETIDELKKFGDVIDKIICVDDGSTDKTPVLLDAQKDNLRIVTNVKNQGQHGATRIGLLQCDSEWALTIDDDLPMAPNEIRSFIAQSIDNGGSLNYASYKNHRSRSREVASRVTNRILLDRFGLKGQGSSTRMINRTVLDKIARLEKSSKFLDIDLLNNAESVNFTEVLALPQSTKSRYSAYKLSKMFFQMLFHR